SDHADRSQRCARGPAGPTDREREIADGAAIELAELGRREATAVDAQERDVGAGVAADDLGVALVEATVCGGKTYRGAVGGVKARGDDEVGGPRDPGAASAATRYLDNGGRSGCHGSRKCGIESVKDIE